MPILKQLVAPSSQTKRRSRLDLTREMISAPLGDFRHTMHVGRSGDAFGDTSFLSSRSGEPSPDTTSFPRSPRPGLLSRTFRSSKRSQSVHRVDQDGGFLAPGGSSASVKNAMSLPFLNNEEQGDGRVAKSLSSSPYRQPGEVVLGTGEAATATAAAAHILELQERSFGELTELPDCPGPYGGGMKHAESVMSFHVDLGPSMLNDILGVMEKEDDDLGYEEGKSSEGRESPTLCSRGEKREERKGMNGNQEEEEKEDDDDDDDEEEDGTQLQHKAPPFPPGSLDLRPNGEGPYTPEIRPRHLQHLDSCSVSSSGSAAMDEKPNSHNYTGDTDSATFSAPPEEECNFSSFLEDEDDEIRV